MAGAFVGRRAELDAVGDLVARLDGGQPGALAVVGEPGIGKTRLLGELSRGADARGYLTLGGTASELVRDLPFWVFVDALEDYVRGLDPAVPASLGADVLAELAHVLPALQARGTTLTSERHRSHRAVRLLLERLAANNPLVLVLDDVHWADSGSWELLLALLRRMPAAPVLIAFALRPHLVPARVARGLERAHRSGALTRLQLHALTLEEAHELLAESASGEPAADTLYAESGGNPFYLDQLARSLRRTPGTAAGDGGEALARIEVPPAVAASLAEELSELSGDALLVLQAAAVAGDPFEPELAAAASATSEEAVLVALDELLDRDLVGPTELPRRFRFRHPLVRRAVYELAPGGWRLGAHARCAAALAEWGAPAAVQATHVELSARQGDAQAVAVLREAGDAAARHAPATAARWYEGALRLLGESGPVEDRVELLLARAGSLLATGHFTESHAALLESIRLVPAKAVALRVRLVTKCAVVEHQLGRYAQARARLERALEELDGQASPTAVGLMLELAINRLFEGDFPGMNRWSDRAIAAAGPLGDRALTATALAVQAAGSAMVGASAAGREWRDEAALLIDALPDDELAGHLDALTHLSLAEMYLDCFEESRRHADRALVLSRATAQEDYLPSISAMLGTCSWVRGRIDDALEVLEGAVEAARLIDDPHGLCWTLFNLSDAASAAGRLEVALATGEESWELAGPLDPGPIPAHAGCAFALALLNAGEAERAAGLLVEAAGGPDLRLIGGAWRGRYLEVLTRCCLAAGRPADAERAATAARACADEVDLPFAHATADLARAALELEDGDGRSAGSRALAAVAALESVGHAYGAAQARVVAGRALAVAGERDRAAAELERAATDLATYGAARGRAEAERELRKLGRTVYRRSAAGTAESGVASLTERELQLSRLVVDRKTNPQIAAELFLSQKTVETHLRNIFRKVGVSSRVELARAVERADHEQAR